MTDEKRLQWLENFHTPHVSVRFLYVVDGYRAVVEYDDTEVGGPVIGETLDEAIDLLARIWADRGIRYGYEVAP